MWDENKMLNQFPSAFSTFNGIIFIKLREQKEPKECVQHSNQKQNNIRFSWTENVRVEHFVYDHHKGCDLDGQDKARREDNKVKGKELVPGQLQGPGTQFKLPVTIFIQDLGEPVRRPFCRRSLHPESLR